MGLIKSIVRCGDESLPRQDHSGAVGLPYLFRDTSFPVAARDGDAPTPGDGGAEMFSVDCSLQRRKFALSFSL